MPAAEVSEEVKQRKVSSPPLPKSAFRLRECVSNDYRAVIPAGTHRSRLLDSDFWISCSDLLHATDTITCLAADRSYLCFLYVLEASRASVFVHELSFHELPAVLSVGESLPDSHEVFYAGPQDLWCIRRKCDGVMLNSPGQFSDKYAAIEFLINHATMR